MKIERIEIRNYKAIKNIEGKLKGNVFIVHGENNVGKSTFAKAFLKLVARDKMEPTPVTEGEKEGEITGHFVSPEGDKYTVTVEFTNSSNTIRMITPEGIITRKINDIKKLFDYHNVDIEEFVALGETEPGRKKQRDVILEILPEDVQDKFHDLEGIIKHLYELRRDKNVETKSLKEQLSAFQSVKGNIDTAEARKKLDDLKYQRAVYKTLRDRLTVLDESISHAKSFYKEQIQRQELYIKDLKKQLQNAEKDLQESYSIKEEKINKMTKEKEEKQKEFEASYYPTDEELAMATNEYEGAIRVTEQKDQKEIIEKKFIEANSKAKEVDSKLVTKRLELSNIVLAANLNIPRLELREDGLYYNNLPFTKNQLSTSEIIKTVFKIMLAMNKKTPIFFLGRAESLDKNNWDLILQEAKEEGYQLFVDKVDSGPLQIEITETLK